MTRPDAGEWSWGLELLRYGFAGLECEVATPHSTRVEGQRLSYDWDEHLTEWYINDGRGLEHGYTIHGRPPGYESGQPLTLVVSILGDLVPDVQQDGRGVSFLDAGGSTVLTYSGLTVFDADMQTVPARIEVVEGSLHFIVEERGACYPLTIDPIAQGAYFKASNTGSNDSFGWVVAVSGNTAVVGAHSEDSDASGINGDGSNDNLTQAGAVYVFVRNGGTWSQEAYLKSSNTGISDRFGRAVAISNDTIVVGSYWEDSSTTGVNGDQTDNSESQSGAAYVFVRNAGTWTQEAYLKASNTESDDFFGRAVAVSGNTIVVGADGEDSNATGVDGDQSDNSASFAGAAYVFVRVEATWNQQAYLKASNAGSSDFFGAAVAVSGDTVVIGAYWEASNATGINGDQANNFASRSGAAYVFSRSGSTWIQEAYLKSSNTGVNDRFGSKVAIAGDTVAIAAPFEGSDATGIDGDQSNNNAALSGAVYAFGRDGSNWSQQAYIKASNTDASDFFGNSVSVSNDTLVAGAPGESSAATGVNGDQSSNSVSDSGAAYVFVRSGVSWSQEAYLKASSTGALDAFGASVAVSGDMVIIGSPNEDSGATGVNGDQSDNSASQAGAAYAFDLNACSIALMSSEIVDLGSPSNPNAFRPGLTSGPVIGATWDPFVDHTSFMPRAIMDTVLLQRLPVASGSSLQISLAGYIGTLICQPTRVFFFADPVPAGDPFSFAIPLDCSIVGRRYCAQAASTNAFGTTRLTNALRITIGSF